MENKDSEKRKEVKKEKRERKREREKWSLYFYRDLFKLLSKETFIIQHSIGLSIISGVSPDNTKFIDSEDFRSGQSR